MCLALAQVTAVTTTTVANDVGVGAVDFGSIETDTSTYVRRADGATAARLDGAATRRGTAARFGGAAAQRRRPHQEEAAWRQRHGGRGAAAHAAARYTQPRHRQRRGAARRDPRRSGAARRCERRREERRDGRQRDMGCEVTDRAGGHGAAGELGSWPSGGGWGGQGRRTGCSPRPPQLAGRRAGCGAAISGRQERIRIYSDYCCAGCVFNVRCACSVHTVGSRARACAFSNVYGHVGMRDVYVRGRKKSTIRPPMQKSV
jgi:hypothetical protein